MADLDVGERGAVEAVLGAEELGQPDAGGAREDVDGAATVAGAAGRVRQEAAAHAA